MLQIHTFVKDYYVLLLSLRFHSEHLIFCLKFTSILRTDLKIIVFYFSLNHACSLYVIDPHDAYGHNNQLQKERKSGVNDLPSGKRYQSILALSTSFFPQPLRLLSN